MFHATITHGLQFTTPTTTMITHSIERVRVSSKMGRIITERVNYGDEMAGIGLSALVLARNSLTVPEKMRTDSISTRATFFILMQT